MPRDSFYAHIIKSQMHPLVAGYMTAKLDHNRHHDALHWNRLSAYMRMIRRTTPKVDVKNLIDSILHLETGRSLSQRDHARALYLAYLSDDYYQGWLSPIDVPRLDRYDISRHGRHVMVAIEQDENHAIIAYTRTVEIVQGIEQEFLSSDQAVYFDPDYPSVAVERTFHVLSQHAPVYAVTLLALLVQACSFTVQPALAPDFAAFAESTVGANY
jgi:hypothetical protein